MDFFDTLNSSKEAELAYANWYAKLPDQRKAQMLSDLFQFGIESVKYNAKRENPFITESEALLSYIELNLKDSYSEEVYSFIVKKLKEKSEEEWKLRFKKMKKELGWSYQDMATHLGGVSTNALKASISRKLPSFAKLAVCVYETVKKV